MNKSRQNRLILGALALVLGGAPRFYAQQAETQSPSTTSSQGKPQAGAGAGESSSNDAQAQLSDNGEIFIGVVVKSGDTFVLRHASGKIYDVDHPEELKQYEGLQVRVKGTLDPDGKTIHME